MLIEARDNFAAVDFPANRQRLRAVLEAARSMPKEVGPLRGQPAEPDDRKQGRR